MKTKVCTKCGEEKEVSKFYNNKQSKDGKHPSCILCRKKYLSKNKSWLNKNSRKYWQENKSKFLKKAREYKKENKESIKVKNAEYWASENGKNVQQKYQSKSRKQLKDNYLKDRISCQVGCDFSEIPNWMIEAKRIEIKAHRLYNKNKTHNKND